MTPKKRTEANMRSTEIAAAVGGFYAFEAREDAQKILDRIKESHTLSKEQPVEGIALWIRGYELTAAEKTKGYRGNFARLWVELQLSGYYTILAEKIEMELKAHPQRDRPKASHPNRAHPLLRAVEKGKTYSSVAEAKEWLMRFQLEFPAATIPTGDGLSVMLYNRQNKTTGGGQAAGKNSPEDCAAARRWRGDSRGGCARDAA